MSERDATETIRIAAALLLGPDGRALLVRKHGTTAFMQPGGKIEPGETPVDALARELHEELAVSLPEGASRHLGRFSAPAANEPGRRVEADVFRVDWHGLVAPAAEIAEARWVDPASPGDIELAPLTRSHVLPLAVR
ncbi:NUDIX domain-containing protein [Methylopila sp. M107]|uniref:NUDIX hydrolase n=1 Tax=Methylopila sp. M107 TaxID=1101190 RepID=UPI000374AA30|nr:NUDIX domain-containing protein [Methylopila sp. M107]